MRVQTLREVICFDDERGTSIRRNVFQRRGDFVQVVHRAHTHVAVLWGVTFTLCLRRDGREALPQGVRSPDVDIGGGRAFRDVRGAVWRRVACAAVPVGRGGQLAG